MTLYNKNNKINSNNVKEEQSTTKDDAILEGIIKILAAPQGDSQDRWQNIKACEEKYRRTFEMKEVVRRKR